MTGKVLTKTQQQLVDFCGSERQGLALSQFIVELPDRKMTEEELEHAVLMACVWHYERLPDRP